MSIKYDLASFFEFVSVLGVVCGNSGFTPQPMSGLARNAILFCVCVCQKSLSCLEDKSMAPNYLLKEDIYIFVPFPATLSSYSRALGRLGAYLDCVFVENTPNILDCEKLAQKN